MNGMKGLQVSPNAEIRAPVTRGCDGREAQNSRRPLRLMRSEGAVEMVEAVRGKDGTQQQQQ